MKNKRNYLLGGLFAAVVLMAVGYSALAQKLTINGTANITSTWNVAITSITEKGKTGTATVVGTPSFTANSATFAVDFKTPGDSVTFDIVVKNTGSLDAVLNALTITPTESATSGIKYTVTGVAKSDKLPATSGTDTVTVKAEWVGTDTTVPATKTKSLTVTLDYIQDTSA